MNKQQLANKIWATANQMRSKIEAYEYKDFILGFIFYKFLSEREEKFLLANGYTREDLKSVSEYDPDVLEWVQDNLGISSATKISFLLGFHWKETLMSLMSEMVCPPLVVAYRPPIVESLIMFLKLCKLG